MGDKTGIEWADATWNPVTGCSKVSEGCRNCYAERTWPRLQGLPAYAGRAFGDVRIHLDRMDQPQRWRRPRRIFVNSLSDLFHESLTFHDIARIYGRMQAADWHTYLVLTKRIERAREFYAWFVGEWLLKGDLAQYAHVWLGASVESDDQADRIHTLLQIPSRHFLSYEPALGPLDVGRWLGPQALALSAPGIGSIRRGLDWVIAGGESGPKARPAHPAWFQSVRQACATWSVPFLFKQWGEWCPNYGGYPASAPSTVIHDGGLTNKSNSALKVWRVGKKLAGRILDGRTHDEYPRVRAAEA